MNFEEEEGYRIQKKMNNLPERFKKKHILYFEGSQLFHETVVCVPPRCHHPSDGLLL